MENMENEKPGQLPILEKNSEQTSHRKGNCTSVGQWMYIGLLMNDVWTWEMSMISNQLSEVQPPDTVRAALSGIQKKTSGWGGRGIGLWKCMDFWVDCCGNTWQFSSFIFFSERHGLKHGRKFSVWNMTIWWKMTNFLKTFFKSRFDQHPFAP